MDHAYKKHWIMLIKKNISPGVGNIELLSDMIFSFNLIYMRYKLTYLLSAFDILLIFLVYRLQRLI